MNPESIIALLLVLFLVWITFFTRRINRTKRLPKQKELTLEEQKFLLDHVRKHKKCNGTGRLGWKSVPLPATPGTVRVNDKGEVERAMQKVAIPCGCIERGLELIEEMRMKR